MRRLLLYRSELLTYSETFIAAQAGAIRGYSPILAGAQRVAHSLPLPVPSFVVAEGDSPISRARRLAFRRTGHAPGLVAELRALRPELMHAHFALDAAEALPLSRALKIPIVATLHGYDVMVNDATHRRTPRGALYLARRKALFDEAELFFCVSKAIRDKACERGFPPEKLRVQPIGIDVAQYAPAAHLPAEPMVLFVGRLVEKKGCAHLIRAMRLVHQSLASARLVVVGDGPERAQLEAEAARLGINVHFAGVQSSGQVHKWMAQARTLAVPSVTARNGDAEGLPTVLVEALAMGLPVACFRNSGIPELVRHSVEGLLAEEGDSDTLAGHLLRICEDEALAARLGSAGRLRVEQSFALGPLTEQLEAYYDGVLLGSAASHAPRPASGVNGWAVKKPGELPSLAASATKDISSGLTSRSADWRGGETQARPVPARPSAPPSMQRLRSQALWMISGNGAAILFQAVYFVLIGRMLGSREYGSLVGVVALINVLSQFSSLGMEMVLLRNVSQDQASFAPTWGKALVVSAAGFLLLLGVSILYGRIFLAPGLRMLVPWVAVSDGLLGKLAQLASRALQGADHAAWSARLTALTTGARTLVAGALLAYCVRAHEHASALTWVRVYWLASLAVAVTGCVLVTRLLGRPRFARLGWRELGEGLSFSFSSSAISVYNDIDKTLLVSMGQGWAAGIYAAGYRVMDVVSAPIYSLFAAATPRFFREGAQGVAQASRFSQRMLRWTIPFGMAAALGLALCAPMLPWAFGRSFHDSVSVLRWLCLLPLIRGLHYAWGTTITASSSQWLRTATQAGAAMLNLGLNLVLIPRWSWQGAAVASLITDGALALSNGLLVAGLLRRESKGAPSQHAKERFGKTNSTSGWGWLTAPLHPRSRS